MFLNAIDIKEFGIMMPKRLKNILMGLRTERWMQTLLQEGSVYIVGGTVRDAFRDEDIKDIDLVVEKLSMAQIKDLLKPYGRVDEVGEFFAVIKFRPRGHEGEDFDIAIPRVDIKTGEGHKDFKVKTKDISLEEDLFRRDFTINSIAVNIETDEIVDPFYGVGDIRRKRINATDQEAFAEDPLRILRGIQFSSRFGYEITPETLDLMKEYSPRIKNISGERIFDELMKVLNKKGDTQKALDLIHQTDVDKALFDKKMLHYDKGLNYLDPTSFFYVLGLLGDVDPGDFIRNRLKGDAILEKNVRMLNNLFTLLPRMQDEEELKYMLSKAFTAAPDIMDVVIFPKEVDDIILQMRLGKIPNNIKDVAIDGDDIKTISRYKEGPEIGFILEKILRDALANKFNWKDKDESLVYLTKVLTDMHS